MQSTRTRKLVILAMLSVMAYAVMYFGRIPILTVPPYLKYDPKDFIIAIGGFIFGPLSVVAMSIVVSFLEMVTASETGIIGAVMNIVSTCAFACTAAIIYKSKRTLKRAVIGLISGVLMVTIVMLLWNYFLTPIYTGYPREAVAAMLVPVFLPFNLLKGGLNAAITMLLYKPIRAGLSKSRLLPEDDGVKAQSKVNIGAMLASFFVLVSGVLLILVYQGKI